MSETKHTPEPWVNKGAGNIRSTATDQGIALVGTTWGDGAVSHNQNIVNAERIVACVNGCAGIADPSAVKAMYEALNDPCMMPALEAWAKGKNANAVRCLENARAALAQAEGR
ncbi:MAG: hypothetical protein M0R37_10365 [Bacteroidales bacterium]|nr:hypothetical protein [Bacteroidales bacterium]